MTVYYSVASGNWEYNAIWSASSGGAGGAGVPLTGDTAIIETGCLVYNNYAIACKLIYITSGGVLRIDHNITFDDNAGAGIYIYPSAGGMTTTATLAAPLVMGSASVVPAHPWSIRVEPVAGNDARTLDLDYIDMRGMSPVLGYGTTYVLFNQPGGGAWVNNVPPLSREPVIIEHQIDRRAYSRVYPRGCKAGVTTMSGFVEWSAFYHLLLRDMLASGNRMSFYSQYVQVPKCRVTGKISYPTKAGQTIVPFSLTLIEDR